MTGAIFCMGTAPRSAVSLSKCPVPATHARYDVSPTISALVRQSAEQLAGALEALIKLVVGFLQFPRCVHFGVSAGSLFEKVA